MWAFGGRVAAALGAWTVAVVVAVVVLAVVVLAAAGCGAGAAADAAQPDVSPASATAAAKRLRVGRAERCMVRLQAGGLPGGSEACGLGASRQVARPLAFG
jgi:hypothetical protein